MTRTHTTPRRTSLALLALGLVAGLASPALAETWVLFPGDSLSDAIDRAEDGDTIALKAGVWDEELDLNNRWITIAGGGKSPNESVILCGGHQHHIRANWDTETKVKFENLTFMNDDPESNCSIQLRHPNGSTAFTNCHFIGLVNAQESRWNCVARGPIWIRSGHLMFTGCEFVGNSVEARSELYAAALGGVIFSEFSDLVIRDSTFIGNEARARLTGDRIDARNTVQGGAIYAYRTNTVITGSTFRANRAANFGAQPMNSKAQGGAVNVDNWEQTHFGGSWYNNTRLEGNTFEANSVEWETSIDSRYSNCNGGAVWVFGSGGWGRSHVLGNNDYIGNTSDQESGALHAHGAIEVVESRFDCNLPNHLGGDEYQALDNQFLECPPPCPADLDGNGTVDFNDYMLLVQSWGPAEGSPADLNEDGLVNYEDMILLFDAWGGC